MESFGTKLFFFSLIQILLHVNIDHVLILASFYCLFGVYEAMASFHTNILKLIITAHKYLIFYSSLSHTIVGVVFKAIVLLNLL